MNRKTSILPIVFLLFFSFYSFASENPENQPSDANEVTSEMLGEWTCIAYVENIDDFTTEQEMSQEMLFLKGIEFKDDGLAEWIFDDDCSYTGQWDSETIISILEVPASHQLKQLHNDLFLFIEWISNDVTILNRKPCYYVLKKSTGQNDASSSDSGPVGKWTVVDFVKEIEDFDPKQRSLNTLPRLRKLYFQKSGTVWWIYDDNFKSKKTWRGNAVDDEPSYPAHFTIKQFNDKDYLFIEWISGDVTERGQKPYYYVLKKVE